LLCTTSQKREGKLRVVRERKQTEGGTYAPLSKETTETAKKKGGVRKKNR